MNQHLNIFRFFNEYVEKDFIENNLTRAFAICLSNNSLFLSDYLKSILEVADYNYLFSTLGSDTKFSINLQVETNLIDRISFSKVYAIAMTTDNALSMEDFFEQKDQGEKGNIADIFIEIKDIAIVIEVKRTEEDCKAQLYNQVLPFVKDNFTVLPKKFSWPETVKLMERIHHLQKLTSQDTVFIQDFLRLSAERFPKWFEPKPFNLLPFTNIQGTSDYINLEKRIRQAFLGSKYELLPYANRIGINVPFKWASELIPVFNKNNQLKDKEFIAFYIWPGNTKQQGSHIYYKPLDWQKQTEIKVGTEVYELDIAFSMKLCHFNRYVSGLNFYGGNLFKEINTRENYNNKSGKWLRSSWKEFEEFLDDCFKPEYNWREECNWVDNFLNTDRNYFTMSIGYEVCVLVPYSKFRELDKIDQDIKNVSDFINEIANSLSHLI